MSNEASNEARIFVIGGTRIVEDETMRGVPVSEVQALLKHAYPQVENATARERTDEETGATIIEFVAKPGRKG